MPELYSFPFSAMGTECNLHFYTEGASRADEIADLAIAEVYRIEDRYSRYLPDSLLSEINRVAQAGGGISVDNETGGLLDYAYACHSGLFDISCGILRQAWGDFSSDALPPKEKIDSLLSRVGLDKISWKNPDLKFPVPGMELDFGGIGKEYAADRAAEVCISLGIRHGLVDLGGDIHVIGPHPDMSPWLIGIRHPRNTGSLMGNIELSKGALASSGDYERCMVIGGIRYGHIINPLTGWPIRGLTSVSVVADKCIVAGGICTIAMLKGVESVRWLMELGEPHLWADENDNQGGTLTLL